MKVILTEDVNKVGRRGDLVEVSDGYGRNFLIKKGSAFEATAAKIREWEEQQKNKQKREEKRELEAKELKKKLGGKQVTIKMSTGEEGRLFGSVTTGQIATALAEQHSASIDKKDIRIDDSIKQTGNYSFKIKLYPGVEVELTLIVEGN